MLRLLILTFCFGSLAWFTNVSGYDKRCESRSASGVPVRDASQTKLEFLPSTDGTKYNYNEVLHKSLLFYEAQKSGRLPEDNRIPWRGHSALKDGCDIGVDATGGWYNAGDFMKFNFPMAFTLTVLSWGGITFRDAYSDSGELEHMIKTVEWGTKYFIRCHVSQYELVGQVGDGKTDHDNWGRPEELTIARPTYTITENNPGSELAGEVSAALAASSIFLKDTDHELSQNAIKHSIELLEFAEKHRGLYHESIVAARDYYKSYSGYEDELLWASAWIFKATQNSTYLRKAKELYIKIKGEFVAEEYFSWDSKFLGGQALLAEITGEDDFRKPYIQYLEGLAKAKTTRDGLYYINDHGPNRYAANAALLCIVATTLEPPIPNRAQHLSWAEKQIGLLLGDSGRSYVIGFGKNYPKKSHHRSSSCPPSPKKCDWSTYHSQLDNHYILYGGLVGGPDKNGMFNDKRDAHQQNQVACNYNAGFQSAVAGLKHFAMKERKSIAKTTEKPETKTSLPISPPTTVNPAERKRCSQSSSSGKTVTGAVQTVPRFKPNTDGTKYNYNEVLHKSILFYEAQRAGRLPTNNRISWRGDSALKDGCDVKVDLSGGWYDGGNYVKFGLPMAFSLTTLSWGAILFGDSYEDAGELENMIDCIKWPTKYLIKAHISKYEMVGQVGNPEIDHKYWGRPEQFAMDRPTFKLTPSNPGSEIVAESAAALAASSIFLKDHDRSLSSEALRHAMELYEFADKFKGSYNIAIPQATDFYGSYSGYKDELIWAAIWLYKATKDRKYLNKAVQTYNETMEEFQSEVSFTWDSKFIGCQALLSEITKEDIYRTAFSHYLDTLQVAKTTPEGLYYYGDWAPNRYTGGAAFMAVLGVNISPQLPKRDEYLSWAKKQINLLLGEAGRSYVIGFGENYPVMVHHRASSCPPMPSVCDWTTYHSPSGNHYLLYGALVGGPRNDGSYRDEREAYEGSQVGLDYNAAFQSAVAGLKYVAMLQKKGLWIEAKPTEKVQIDRKLANKLRCSFTSPNGSPVYGGIQTNIIFKPNQDGTKYNYNEVLHKSILFYEAQRSGPLPHNKRIPWRGNSGLKDGCDIDIDATGGWYDGGDHMKFVLPMAFSLTTLAWGGIEFREAYKDAAEYHNMVECVKWTTEFLIKAHITKFELIAQVGKEKYDHEYWGRPEEMTMERPTYLVTQERPGTEIVAEAAAALAASSLFLNETHKMLAQESLQHAIQLFEFAESYRGIYHFAVPVENYKSYTGFEDELVWAASWLYRATNRNEYLIKAREWYEQVKNISKEEFSWDYKLVGAEALLAQLTGEEAYRKSFKNFLDGLFTANKTKNGMYRISEWAPNRHTGGAAFMAMLGAVLKPSLPHPEDYIKWAEKQIGLLLGDSGMSHMIGFGPNYPRMPHHRSSSCPPYPEKCEWSTYHSFQDNYYVLYGALVGGTDEGGNYNDDREAYRGSQVGCDYNAGFQSAVAGLKSIAMRKRNTTDAASEAEPRSSTLSTGSFFFQILNNKILTKPTAKQTDDKPNASQRCSPSSPGGSPVFRAGQTSIHFKPDEDNTEHNYNEVLHKSILFFEAQRSGHLPSNNRIPWRGDSALKDGCDIGVDLTGGWYDAGDFVKFGFPMAFSLTTLSWGGITFREAYIDAGEYHHLIESIKWGTEYLIKAHISKYQLVGQVGHGKRDHDNWGRPETINSDRPTYKITSENPGTELAAETAAALAASSIFLANIHAKLASKSLAHAKELYEFADKYRGLYHESIPDAAQYYKSFSGYDDELIWGAAWLYKATGDRAYLKKAKENYNRIHGRHIVEEQFTWDRKLSGAQALLAEITGEAMYRDPLEGYLDKLLRSKKTPEGLYYHSEWGPNRYTAAAAFIATVGSMLVPPLPNKELYVKWATEQIGLILGDAENSYVVGYGKNYPKSPHHRSSSCPPYPEPCDWSTFNSPHANHYTLYGALVGGPHEDGKYQDKRSIVEQSEVACDYNACFQSAVAGVKHFAMKSRTKDSNPLNSTTPRPTVPVTSEHSVTTKSKPKRKVKRVKCTAKNSKCGGKKRRNKENKSKPASNGI